jgi:hypothetical protein
MHNESAGGLEAPNNYVRKVDGSPLALAKWFSLFRKVPSRDRAPQLHKAETPQELERTSLSCGPISLKDQASEHADHSGFGGLEPTSSIVPANIGYR